MALLAIKNQLVNIQSIKAKIGKNSIFSIIHFFFD